MIGGKEKPTRYQPLFGMCFGGKLCTSPALAGKWSRREAPGPESHEGSLAYREKPLGQGLALRSQVYRSGAIARRIWFSFQ